MNLPGGARDGGDGDAPADDPAHDPALGGMRAVWREMRDEAPPDRGLADLLAAARRQAAPLPRPSVWQRWVARMRRPPLLALATVAVLIAGAVLIGRRDPVSAVPAPVVGVATRSERGDPARAAPDPGERATSSGAADPAPGDPPRAAVPPASPATRTAELSAVIQAPAARPAGGAKDRTRGALDGSAGGGPDRAPASAAPAAATAYAPSAAAPPGAGAIGDLYRRCDAAARRGDCAAVRRLVLQITRTDPGYRARINPGSPVGSCLAD